MSHNKIIAFQRRGPTQHPVQILVITTPIIPVGPTHTEKDVAGIYTKNSPCIKKIIFRQTTQRYSHKTALHDLQVTVSPKLIQLEKYEQNAEAKEPLPIKRSREFPKGINNEPDLSGLLRPRFRMKLIRMLKEILKSC